MIHIELRDLITGFSRNRLCLQLIQQLYKFQFVYVLIVCGSFTNGLHKSRSSVLILCNQCECVRRLVASTNVRNVHNILTWGARLQWRHLVVIPRTISINVISVLLTHIVLCSTIDAAICHLWFGELALNRQPALSLASHSNGSKISDVVQRQIMRR